MRPVETKPKSPMPTEQLRLTPEFMKLTAKQKIMVETFCVTGDRLLAVNTAYDHKSGEASRMNSYRHFANVRVVAVLNLWAGKSERDIMIDLIEEQIRHAEKGSTAMARLLAQLQSLKFGEARKRKSVDARIPDDARGTYQDEKGNTTGYQDASGKDVMFDE
jgi:hypothetical protein